MNSYSSPNLAGCKDGYLSFNKKAKSSEGQLTAAYSLIRGLGADAPEGEEFRTFVEEGGLGLLEAQSGLLAKDLSEKALDKAERSTRRRVPRTVRQLHKLFRSLWYSALFNRGRIRPTLLNRIFSNRRLKKSVGLLSLFGGGLGVHKALDDRLEESRQFRRERNLREKAINDIE